MTLHFDEYDPESVGTGGLPKPGKCHLLVGKVNLDKLEDGYITTVEEILAHEDESQVGRTSRNLFNTTGKGAQRLQAWLEATKVLTRQDIIDAKAAGETSIDPEYKNAVSKTYFGVLVASEFKGRQKCQVEFTFLGNDDADADEFPRNTDFVPAPPDREKDGSKETVPPDSDDDAPF